MVKGDSSHEELIRRGRRLYERFRYEQALPFFQEAFQQATNCPAAIYNLANTLHMLDREQEAHSLLLKLIRMDDTALDAGCLILRQPSSFRVDALYLMFHVLLYWRRSWLKAFPYAKMHLKCRKRGLKSAWSARCIRREIVELRANFAGLKA
jgi:tetratricopeptide (TPR) repeat protein